MAYERRDGHITLNINTRKKSDKEPTLSGTILLDGKEYEVVLWEKSGSWGKFYSGKKGKEIEPKEKRPFQKYESKHNPSYPPQPSTPVPSMFDDDIPWDA